MNVTQAGAQQRDHLARTTAIGAAPPPSNPSVFGTIDYAASNAATTANRVEVLVDRLCGSIPRPDSNPKGREISLAANGLMDEGMRCAASVSDAMNRINEALDRLDRSLP